MNHAESPKVCEKVLEFFMLIWPITVNFSPNLHYKLLHISIIAILKFCCTIFPVLEVVCGDLIAHGGNGKDQLWGLKMCFGVGALSTEHSTVTSQLQWHEVIIRSDGISCWQKIIIMTTNWFLVWHKHRFCIWQVFLWN